MALILVIDDDPMVRTTLRQILAKGGHDVIEAVNGKQGLQLFRAHGPDLVITDIIMPEKEGIETIMEIRGDNPTAKIIAISGGGRTRNMDYLEIARTVGAESVLAKPFSIKDVIQQVNLSLKKES